MYFNVLLVRMEFLMYNPSWRQGSELTLWPSISSQVGRRNMLTKRIHSTLQWCYNERDGVSNHQPPDCLVNCLFKSRHWLREGNSPGTEFPAQRASNAENVSIWWRHHGAWGGISFLNYLIHIYLILLNERSILLRQIFYASVNLHNKHFSSKSLFTHVYPPMSFHVRSVDLMLHTWHLMAA